MSRKYMKIKKQELKNLVEAEYGMQVEDMHENDRGILLNTDKGIKLLKPCKRDEAKIVFAASAYEYMYLRGFTSLSCINRTIDGKCFVTYEDQAYILQNYINGKVFEINNESSADAAGQLLAKLHIAGEGFVPAPGCHARVDWGKWMDKFKAYAFNIKKFREGIEAEGVKTKFDRAFMKNADVFYDRMYKSYLILKNFGYLEKVQLSMKVNQLTHKQIKKHSILIDENNMLFVGCMEDCAYDIPEVDIADLLEAFTRSNRVELARAALEGYQKIRKLDRKSIKIIQGLLLHPKRFYKVIDGYYGKKKNHTESELIHKLERGISKEMKKDEILEFLEDYLLYNIS